MGVWAIFCGVIAITIGAFGQEFFGSDMYGTSAPGETPVPKWVGKTIFIGIGAVLVLAGILSLVFKS